MSESEQSLKLLRREISTELKLRNPPKYEKWLPRLRYSGYLMRGPHRLDKGTLFEVNYLWPRELDDVADGDRPIPAGYASRAAYVKEKRDFLRNPGVPHDDVDRLILYSQELSVRTGVNLQWEQDELVQSILTDAERFGTRAVFPQAELQRYFDQCDYPILDGTLKLAGYNPKTYRKYVIPLMQASRKYHNLRDFSEDVNKRGQVNISQEDCVTYRITDEDLGHIDSPGLRAWFQGQSQQGMDLLAEHKVEFPKGHFYIFGRLFAEHYHALPAQRFFEAQLAQA